MFDLMTINTEKTEDLLRFSELEVPVYTVAFLTNELKKRQMEWERELSDKAIEVLQGCTEKIDTVLEDLHSYAHDLLGDDTDFDNFKKSTHLTKEYVVKLLDAIESRRDLETRQLYENFLVKFGLL